MPNAYGVPELSVHELARKHAAGEAFILLDVREPAELLRARLGDWVELAPMSTLVARQLDGLPPAVTAGKGQEIIVMCHTGVRSAQVAAWLLQNGWSQVFNLQGGIDAYARLVDPGVGFY